MQKVWVYLYLHQDKFGNVTGSSLQGISFSGLTPMQACYAINQEGLTLQLECIFEVAAELL